MPTDEEMADRQVSGVDCHKKGVAGWDNMSMRDATLQDECTVAQR